MNLFSVKAPRNKALAICATLVLAVLSCSRGVCEDAEVKETDAKANPIPVVKVKDDYYLYDYTIPAWEMFVTIDKKEYSSSVRSLINKLPSISEVREIALVEYPISGGFFRALDPDSPKRYPFFERWLRDECHMGENESLWPIPEDALNLLNGVVATLMSDVKLVDFFQRYQNALNDLPDEVTWKKDVEEGLKQFVFVWSLETWTFSLYAMEYDKDNYIEGFKNDPSIDRLGRLASTYIGLCVFDKSFDVYRQLPKSRYARLFPKQLKDLKEMLEDPKVIEWKKKNNDKFVAKVGELSMTVDGVFSAFNAILQQYDSVVKK